MKIDFKFNTQIDRSKF